jgi:hypothetical protein
LYKHNQLYCGKVEEVTDVMRNNMSKILEREGKLGELELR